MKNYLFLLIVLLSFTSIIAQTLDLSPVYVNKPSSIKALIIGVSKYKDHKGITNLNYAAKDALKFKAYLENIGVTDILYYADSNATNWNNISAEVVSKLFRNSNPNDLFIVYFSGHGATSIKGDKTLLLLHNYDKEKTWLHQDKIALTGDMGLNMFANDVLKDNQRILLIIDACYIGASTRTTSTNNIINPNWGKRSPLQLISSNFDKPSEENDTFKSGVYTNYFLKGIEGYADADSNGIITFGEIASYTLENVKSTTNNKQVPISFTDDPSYILFDINNSEQQPKAIINGITNNTNELPIKPKESTCDQSLIELFNKSLDNDLLLDTLYLNDNRETSEYLSLIQKQELKGVKTKKNSPCLAYNIKKNIVGIGGENGKIKLFDTKTQQNTSIINTGSSVYDICFTPNGDFLAVSFQGSSIKLWDMTLNKWHPIIYKSRGSASKIAISPNGRILASADFKGTLRLFNIEYNEPLLEVNTVNKRIYDLEFSPDNTTIYSCGDGKKLESWVIKTKSHIVNNQKTESVIRALEYLPKTNKIVSIEEKGNIHYWNPTDLQLVGALSKKSNLNSVLDFKFDLTENQIFIGGRKHVLETINLNVPSNSRSNIKVNRGITELHLNSLEGKLYASNYGGEIECFDFYIPGYNQNAQFYYDSIQHTCTNPTTRALIDNKLILQLQQYANNVLSLLIHDKNVTVEEIKEAIYYLEYALDIERDSDNHWLNKKINTDKTILSAYLTLVTFDSKSYAKQIENLQQIANDIPEDSFTEILLSYLYYRINEINEAFNSTDRAIKKAPTSIEPKIAKAKLYLYEGNYKSASSLYDTVITMAPEHYSGYIGLADVNNITGNYQVASNLYSQALSKDISNIKSLMKNGSFDLTRGNYINAIHSFEKALKLDSTSTLPYTLFAQTYYILFTINKDSNTLKKAIEFCTIARKKDCYNPNAWATSALLYLNLNDYNSKPDLINLFTDLNFTNEELLHLSQKYANKAFELDQFSEKSILVKALCFYKNGDIENARKTIDQSIEKLKNLPYEYAIKAEFEFYCKRYKQSFKAIKNSIHRHPEYAPIYELLARYYQHQYVTGKMNADDIIKDWDKEVINSTISVEYQKGLIYSLNGKFPNKILLEVSEKEKDFTKAVLATRKLKLLNSITSTSLRDTISNHHFVIKNLNNYFLKTRNIHNNNHYGVITIEGTVIVDAMYLEIYQYKNFIAAYTIQNEIPFIHFYDENGVLIKEIRGELTKPITDGYIEFSLNAKRGCYNINGELLIPPTYKTISTKKNIFGTIKKLIATSTLEVSKQYSLN